MSRVGGASVSGAPPMTLLEAEVVANPIFAHVSRPRHGVTGMTVSVDGNSTARASAPQW